MKTTIFLLCTAILIVSSTTSYTQENSFRLSPSLNIASDGGNNQNVELTELAISVSIIGNIATTTCEMSFHNPINRILEGELIFPLDEGQTVSRFAMDVNGVLREGVPVEKNKGQQVFESIERRRVDPGLIELVQGNSYRARIYPIPAKGNKRIVLAYNQELKSTHEGKLYKLPLTIDQVIDHFSIRVEILKQSIGPIIETNSFTNFSFEKWDENYIAEAKYLNVRLDHQLVFLIPPVPNINQVFVEKGEISGNTFFYLYLNPETQIRPKKYPNNIAIYWDVSSSSENRRIDEELSLLKRYFKALGNSKVELYLFSNTLIKGGNYTITEGTCDELINTLSSMHYDGGTQLGALDFSLTSAEEILLFTDGLSTYGSRKIQIPDNVIITINSCIKADHSLLSYIANASGGTYINLQNISMNEAYQKLVFQPMQFISAEYSMDISNVYPTLPQEITNSFSCAGILNSSSAWIKLNFGYGKEVVFSKTITICPEKSTSGGTIEKIWAQKKLSELDMLYDENKNEISLLGKRFSMVTRNTSLIVLETLNDYLEYEIEPPAEFQEDYFRILKERQAAEKETAQNNIENAVRLYQEKISWWNTNYPLEPLVYGTDGKLELNDDAESLDEVMVVGYGTQRRSDVTGAISTVEAEAIPMTRADNHSDAKEKDSEEDLKSKGGVIFLAPWNPDAPYLKLFEKVTENDLYEKYLEMKPEYKDMPSFYVDVSEYFEQKGLKEYAIRILSNLGEMQLKNHELMRVMAHRLEQMEQFSAAVEVYKEVLEIRKEEPQSYRDLALALAKNKKYQMSIDILYDAITKSWDGRFPGIESIMVSEMNAIIAEAGKNLHTEKIDKRLLVNLTVDMRIVLNWDADNTDMDLWVTDPNGEKCFYSYKLTQIGGRMSNDFTGGYGPEEFMLKKAIKGKYKVEANYYGSSQQRISGPVTIYLQLFTNYGKPEQQCKEITLRLSENKEVVEIGEFEF